ncbi:hypothetical protein FACS189430_12220 [Bacteroidia bacterium]|nr:hypothetical protein FACS189430_12220 [Bacteroidia bacterium]
MTDKEREDCLRDMEAFRLKLRGNKELSRQFLIDAGIYTKDGVLAEPYKNLYIPREEGELITA